MLEESTVALLFELKEKGYKHLEWCYVWDNDEDTVEWVELTHKTEPTDQDVPHSIVYDLASLFDEGYGVWRLDLETLEIAQIGDAFVPERAIDVTYFDDNRIKYRSIAEVQEEAQKREQEQQVRWDKYLGR